MSWQYNVSLTGRKLPMKLTGSGRYSSASSDAGEISRFLDLPIVDETPFNKERQHMARYFTPQPQERQSRPTESSLRKWCDPDTDDGCEAFGEFDQDEDCAACKESTPTMAKWCRRFSKRPSKEKLAKWHNEEDEEGCAVFGEEYEPRDEYCKACCKETTRRWYWCRKFANRKG